MTKKIIWLLVSCLMVLSLVMASCGTTTVEEEEEEEEEEVIVGEEEEEVVEEEKEMVKDSLGRMVEKPQYGGTFTSYFTGSPMDWDEAFQAVWVSSGSRLIYELLLQGDWAKGASGSGEVGFKQNTFPFPSFMTGCLAESWEIVDDQTMRFKIRKGVHFHDKPPTNGREMNAEDIEYSLMRMATSPKSYNYRNYALGTDLESITALDKWTLEIKSLPGRLSRAYSGYVATQGWTVPREAVEQYGDLRDWENICGTGPFVLTDYIPDSSITYEKNPNYWQKDPFFPENELPYIDGVKILIIADKSTRLAAFRTGKIDQMTDLLLEDKEQFEKTNPELIWTKFLPKTFIILWRVDTKPFDDLKVRQALSMAIDRQTVIDLYFKGDAEMLTQECMPIPEFSHYYTPLEELPPAARELFTYNPDKAKELLAEAGYPDGFKTNIACFSTEADELSIYKDYWDAIGVDLELNVVEMSAMSGIQHNKTYTQMVTHSSNSNRPEMFLMVTKGQEMNYSMVDDPYVNNCFDESAATVITDPERNAKVVKEGIQYLIEMAYSFQPPTPYLFTAWYPWVKGYSGELTPGSWAHFNTWYKYLWVDEVLKRSMGY